MEWKGQSHEESQKRHNMVSEIGPRDCQLRPRTAAALLNKILNAAPSSDVGLLFLSVQFF